MTMDSTIFMSHTFLSASRAPASPPTIFNTSWIEAPSVEVCEILHHQTHDGSSRMVDWCQHLGFLLMVNVTSTIYGIHTDPMGKGKIMGCLPPINWCRISPIHRKWALMCYKHMVGSINAGTPHGWCIIENPIETDNLGNLHIGAQTRLFESNLKHHVTMRMVRNTSSVYWGICVLQPKFTETGNGWNLHRQTNLQGSPLNHLKPEQKNPPSLNSCKMIFWR